LVAGLTERAWPQFFECRSELDRDARGQDPSTVLRGPAETSDPARCKPRPAPATVRLKPCAAWTGPHPRPRPRGADLRRRRLRRLGRRANRPASGRRHQHHELHRQSRTAAPPRGRAPGGQRQPATPPRNAPPMWQGEPTSPQAVTAGRSSTAPFRWSKSPPPSPAARLATSAATSSRWRTPPGRPRRSPSPHSIRPSSKSMRSATLMICSVRSAQPMLVSAVFKKSRPAAVMPFCT